MRKRESLKNDKYENDAYEKDKSEKDKSETCQFWKGESKQWQIWEGNIWNNDNTEKEKRIQDNIERKQTELGQFREVKK